MHHWPGNVDEAERLQEELARRVRLTPLSSPPLTVAGVDAAYAGGKTFAAAVLFAFPALTPLDEKTAVVDTPFPYVPGYLTFREGPAILAALEKLAQPPDLLLVDGQGIAHPRRLGIASHLGVLLGRPAIGCAKSRLVGIYSEPPLFRGSWSPLVLDGETVGAVLRTRSGVRPLFVSPGHLLTLADAIRIVLACCTAYRLPEPQRAADRLTKSCRRSFASPSLPQP